MSVTVEDGQDVGGRGEYDGGGEGEYGGGGEGGCVRKRVRGGDVEDVTAVFFFLNLLPFYLRTRFV